jgi:UV DNA damage endonuclease
MDVMLEAKDKEQAVFELYRIYGLHDVIWENLRPPSEDQSMRPKGRKSAGGKWVSSSGTNDWEASVLTFGVRRKTKKDQKDGVEVPQVEEQPLDPEMIDELADDDDL